MGSQEFRDHNFTGFQIESGSQCLGLYFAQLGQRNGIVRHRHTTGISDTFTMANKDNIFHLKIFAIEYLIPSFKKTENQVGL